LTYDTGWKGEGLGRLCGERIGGEWGKWVTLRRGMLADFGV
jgi:hypothetical protein